MYDDPDWWIGEDEPESIYDEDIEREVAIDREEIWDLLI